MSKPNVEILATKDWVTSLINKVIKQRDSDIKIYSNTTRSMRSSHCSSALFYAATKVSHFLNPR